MQEKRCDGFMVDTQQTLAGNTVVPFASAAQTKKVHAVMVVARTEIIGCESFCAVVQVGRCSGIDRVAQFVENLGFVARCDRYTVIGLVQECGGEIQ